MDEKQNRSHLQRPAEPLVAQARPEPSNHDGSAALDWIVRYAVPLAGVTGAALYGVLRLAYVFFYLWLRATPDEVGYGYSQVLSDELIGAIELVVLIATLIWIIGFSASIFASLAQRVTRKYRSKAAEIHLFGKLKAQRIAVWSLAIAVPIVLIWLPILGWLEGEQAANGYSVRNVYLAGTSGFLSLPSRPSPLRSTGHLSQDSVNRTSAGVHACCTSARQTARPFSTMFIHRRACGCRPLP
jgi:hypothetical protein